VISLAATYEDQAGNTGTTADSDNYTVDTKGPTATITLSDEDLYGTETSTVTVTFSEAVKNFSKDNLTAPNGTLGVMASTDNGITWTGTYTPNANVEDATNVISLAATYEDQAGNTGTTADSDNYTVDTVRPTIAVKSYDSDLKAGDTAQIAFTLSEESSTFTIDDVTVTGGTVGELTKLNKYVYEAVFTPTANSTENGVVSVASEKFTDAAGNNNTDGSEDDNTVTMTVDTIRPTIEISTNKSALKADETATLTFTLSESSANFIKSDINVTGGTLSNFTGSGTSYTAIFTPDSNSTTNGVVSVASEKFTDAASNKNADGAEDNNKVTFTVDTSKPTVDSVAVSDLIITDADTGAGKFSVTVTFSEVMDTASVPTLTFAPSVASTLSNVNGAWSLANTVYTATYDVADANVKLDDITVDVTGAKDAAGNAQQDYTALDEFDIDTTNPVVSPTVAITSNDYELHWEGAGDTALLTFTFSEAVTDFTKDDITVSALGSLDSFTKESSTVYTAVYKPADKVSENVVVSVASGKFTNAAGNQNTDGSTNGITLAVDYLRPTIALTSNDYSLTVGEKATITFTFSEPLKANSFVIGDITVSGGALSNFKGSGTSYTVDFTPSANSTTNGVVKVASNKFKDLVGNDNRDGADADNTVTMTVNTRAIAPIALDLDGDNQVAYLDQSAGLTYQFSDSSELVSAAWVAANDGLLAHRQSDGSLKIVFSTQDGETDLEGLTKIYDSNQDSVLDVADSEFANFGVWQDANSNAKVDAGEFNTLTEKGIINLSLISNGIASTAANGDVLIYGQTTYTSVDGSFGLAQDVAFTATPLPPSESMPAIQIEIPVLGVAPDQAPIIV
jgi:hypothetical protein